MPIHTSTTTQPAQAIVYTSALEQFDAVHSRHFASPTAMTRFTRLSHDCSAAGLLAQGEFDLLFECNVFDYDILPDMPIIEGQEGAIGMASRFLTHGAMKRH